MIILRKHTQEALSASIWISAGRSSRLTKELLSIALALIGLYFMSGCLTGWERVSLNSGLSSEDLLGVGRDARNTDSLIGFLRRQLRRFKVRRGAISW